MTPEHLVVAAAKADKSDEARGLLLEAGRGLMDVHDEARTNTITLASVAKLQVVQGYLSEAAVLFLEIVALGDRPKPPVALYVPPRDDEESGEVDRPNWGRDPDEQDYLGDPDEE